MDFNTLLENLRVAILTGDEEKANELAKISIDNNFDPQKIVDEGIRITMDEVGDRFATGEYFLPDLIRSGEATKAVIWVSPIFVRKYTVGIRETPIGSYVAIRSDLG